jgi:hypothetical protein
MRSLETVAGEDKGMMDCAILKHNRTVKIRA